MRVIMFPGQGSQTKGMGRELFSDFPDLTNEANDVLGYSIEELCLEDPGKELHKTQFTQPAIFVVNALSYYKARAVEDLEPDFLLGHSLGEFNALLAAECFDFRQGLMLVRKRGELMSHAKGGAMAAVLNATAEEIRERLAEAGLNEVELVNFNTPSQIVISGPADEIGKARAVLKKGDIRYLPLNTSGAFHSRMMRPAQREFAEYLAEYTLAPPRIPVISNVTAREYEPTSLAGTLASQIAMPVRWSDSIAYLLEKARAAGESVQFDELGNGEVLTRMIQTIREELPDSETQPDVPLVHSADESDAAAAQPGQSNGQGGPIRVAVDNAPSVAPSEPGKEQDDPGAATSADTTANELSAQQLVERWNQDHAVGTRLKSAFEEYGELTTRTEAVLLFGHRAAVYVEGYNGYFDLREVTVVA